MNPAISFSFNLAAISTICRTHTSSYFIFCRQF